MIESFIGIKKIFSDYFILKKYIKSRYLSILGIIVVTSFILSCSNVQLKNQTVNWENNQMRIQNTGNFSISGAVSLKTKEDNFLGNYKIDHQDNKDYISLTDFFGRSVLSSNAEDLKALLKNSNISFSSTELEIMESLNFTLSSLLIARTSSLPVNKMVRGELGMLESIEIPYHDIRFETYTNFEDIFLPKKVLVSNEFYELTFSLKFFENK